MATAPQLAIEILHVISATVVVGWFAVLPMWKAAARKAGDAASIVGFLRAEGDAEKRLVLPAGIVLLVTGLLMVVGPWRGRFSLMNTRWAQAAALLTVILIVLLVWGLAQPRRKMLDLAEKGEGVGPAMDKLWGEWRTALLSGALLSLLAAAYMVYVGSL